MRITGSKKGKALGNRFFDSIPFSRIAAWGKAFVVTKNYVHQNILEVSGEISYIPRGKKLAPR